jgi:predicted RNase H-like nuclease (RuvC/YqgF family)
MEQPKQPITYTDMAFIVLRKTGAKRGTIFYKCSENEPPILVPEKEEQHRICDCVEEIFRLEKEIQELKNEIEHLQHNPLDQVLVRDWEADFEELNREHEELEAEKQKVQNLKNEYTAKLSTEYWTPTRNVRGAGRKKIIEKRPELVSDVKRLRDEKISYKAIADELGISVGAAYNLSVQKLNIEQNKKPPTSTIAPGEGQS